MTWTSFLGVFLLAQCVGLLSHVPGGLGVFETVVVTLLGGQVDTQAIVGALVAFRAVYYFGPLAVAALLLGAYEVRKQRGMLKRATALVDDWAVAVPHVLAFACFVSGAILLLSGATPALHHRRLARAGAAARSSSRRTSSAASSARRSCCSRATSSAASTPRTSRR